MRNGKLLFSLMCRQPCESLLAGSGSRRAGAIVCVGPRVVQESETRFICAFGGNSNRLVGYQSVRDVLLNSINGRLNGGDRGDGESRRTMIGIIVIFVIEIESFILLGGYRSTFWTLLIG